MRQTWRLIGTILNRGKTDIINESFVCDGQKLVEKHVIAEKFNDYFVNIGNQLASSISTAGRSFSEYLRSSPSDSFALHLTHPYEIMQIVSKLKKQQ